MEGKRRLLIRSPWQKSNHRSAHIEARLGIARRLASPAYPFDEERFRDMAGRSYERGYNPAGIARQLHAITASGDRTSGLRELELPALVIHGRNDLLVNPSGGRATAKAIPGARLKMVDGMGHDLPRAAWDQIVAAIVENARRAGFSRSRAAA